ncbi:MAG: hypothetical protein LBP59_03600 [Planctomycetaceae bacterium]|nr:hypothetical protein [Planctomycetaceae bacterium]
MSEVLIVTVLLVAYRQHAGGTPAIRWSRLHFRIAGTSESQVLQDRRRFRIANISPGVSSDSQAKRLYPRIAGVSPACGCTQPLMRDVYISVCRSAKCRRDARDPVVSPACQDRRHFRIANSSHGVSSDSQAERLHPRIAGVSPACGCTQPLMRDVYISSAFLFALR